MNNNRALQLATEFLYDMNPTGYDGKDYPIPQLDYRIWEDNDTFEDVSIQISIESEKELEFCTYVELVDKATDTMIECQSVESINSAQEIADAIMNLCGNRKER